MAGCARSGAALAAEGCVRPGRSPGRGRWFRGDRPGAGTPPMQRPRHCGSWRPGRPGCRSRTNARSPVVALQRGAGDNELGVGGVEQFDHQLVCRPCGPDEVALDHASALLREASVAREGVTPLSLIGGQWLVGGIVEALRREPARSRAFARSWAIVFQGIDGTVDVWCGLVGPVTRAARDGQCASPGRGTRWCWGRPCGARGLTGQGDRSRLAGMEWPLASGTPAVLTTRSQSSPSGQCPTTAVPSLCRSTPT